MRFDGNIFFIDTLSFDSSNRLQNQDLENLDLEENIKNNLNINYFNKKDYVDYILGMRRSRY